MVKALAKGARVEICPYGRTFSYHDLGHLDGNKGTVISVTSFGTEPHALVKRDGVSGVISYPAAALKPIEED